MKARRFIILALATSALLGITLLWCHNHFKQEKIAAQQAVEDRQRCQELVRDLMNIRSKPALAAEKEKGNTQTIRDVEQAAENAGIPHQCLLRITPEPSQRIGESVYQEKPTRILLRNVSLQQIAIFIHSLMINPQPLHAKSMRISAPRADDTGNNWDAELVLTYLLYRPTVHMTQDP